MKLPIKAVVFDWAGTMIDHGSRAPVVALQRVFDDTGVPITEAEARADMGRAKRDHLRSLLAVPRIAAAWQVAKGKKPNEADVDALHDAVEPMMRIAASDCATLIPGAADLAARLRAEGVAIASCTGYTRPMMADILPRAAAQGYAPDSVVCSGETREGRPSPLMLWKALGDLGIWPALDLREGGRRGRRDRRGSIRGGMDGRRVGIGQRRRAGPCRAGGVARRRAPPADRSRRRRASRGGGGLCRRERRRSLARPDGDRRADRRRRTAPGMTATASSPSLREGAVTRWLRTAPPIVFALYGGIAAFATYFAMYAYRKPFTAGAYAHVPGLAVRDRFQNHARDRAGRGLRACPSSWGSRSSPRWLRATARRGDPPPDRPVGELALVGFAVGPPPVPACSARCSSTASCSGHDLGAGVRLPGGPPPVRDPGRHALRQLHPLVRRW